MERGHRNGRRYFYNWEKFSNVDELNRKLAEHLEWSSNKIMRTLGNKEPGPTAARKADCGLRTTATVMSGKAAQSYGLSCLPSYYIFIPHRSFPALDESYLFTTLQRDKKFFYLKLFQFVGKIELHFKHIIGIAPTKPS